MTELDGFEDNETTQIDISSFKIEKEEKEFFPNGAIVFFILLIVLCLVIWYGIYFLMLART